MALAGNVDWTHGLLTFVEDQIYGEDELAVDDDDMLGFDFTDDFSVRSDLIVNFVSADSENSSGMGDSCILSSA